MKANLLKILGIVILVFVLSKVNISLVWENMKGCNITFLLAAIAVEIICVVAKVVRWNLILKMLEVKTNFLTCLRAYWAGLYIGIVTPGKIGDISRAYFLNRSKKSIARPIFSVILDRLMDIASLLLLGLAAGFFYLKEIQNVSILLLTSLFVLGASVWFILKKKDFFYALFKKIVDKLSLGDKVELKENLDLGLFARVKARDFFLLFIYVMAGWLIFFSGWWLLSKALYISLSFPQVVGAISIATVVALLPVSISGLGTRDAAIIFIFSQMGIGKESAVSFSLSIFIIGTAIICVGIIPFLQNLKYDNSSGGV